MIAKHGHRCIHTENVSAYNAIVHYPTAHHVCSHNARACNPSAPNASADHASAQIVIPHYLIMPVNKMIQCQYTECQGIAFG